MGEKRKPDHIWLLKKQGKKTGTFKIELFDAHLFQKYRDDKKAFRIRFNGKWFNNKDGSILFVTKTQFRDILFRSIKL